MNKLILPDLNGIPQTLLLPLIGRAKFSGEAYSPIRDEKAVELINSINYNFDNLLKNANYQTLFWMARAYHFDQEIKAFLEKNPKVVVINLGCGLDTTFSRVDNGKLTWIDLDLPNVIDLRKKILPASNREHYIAKSILDFSWMSDVQRYGDTFFFIAGGLFMYFTSNEVKSLFLNMEKYFPGCYLVFDNIAPRGLRYANKMLEKSDMKNALLQWSLHDASEIEKWSSNFKVASHYGYFNDIKNKYKFPLWYKFLMYFFDFNHKSGIIKLQFGVS